jgi:hypothetical protein
MGFLFAQAMSTALADQLIYQIGITSEAGLLSSKLLNSDVPPTETDKAADRRRKELGVGERSVLTLTVTKAKANLTDAERAQIKTLIESAEWTITPADPEIAVIEKIEPEADTKEKRSLWIKIPIKQQGVLTYPSLVLCATAPEKLVDGKAVTVKAKIPSLPDLDPAEITFTIRTPKVMIGKRTNSSSANVMGSGVVGADAIIKLIPTPIEVNFGAGVWVREIPRENGKLLPLNATSIFHPFDHVRIAVFFIPIEATYGGIIDRVRIKFNDPGTFGGLSASAVPDGHYGYWSCDSTWAGASEPATALALAGVGLDNSQYIRRLGEQGNIKQEFRSKHTFTFPGSSGTTGTGVIEIEKAGAKVIRSATPVMIQYSDNFP